MNDEMRTIEESYTSATTTSNMRVQADKRSDADILIASGWTPGILGSALMRLHGEWDSTSRRANTQTDAMLLFGQLKSLPTVLAILTRWAEEQGVEAPRTLAQAVTAHWLDSNCHHCHGRGKDVIPGTPMLGRQCRHCGGTGKQAEPRGMDGRKALNMMDNCIQGARNSIKRRLRDMQG